MVSANSKNAMNMQNFICKQVPSVNSFTGNEMYEISMIESICIKYKWDASGQQNGQFKYQNTSTNAPWNTLSTSLNIK